jgi:hypothetical protein
MPDFGYPDPWGEFDLAGHHFSAHLPGGPPDVWTIIVTRDDEEVRRETVSMMHAPRFGPDQEDVARLDRRIEEIIRELGLES